MTKKVSFEPVEGSSNERDVGAEPRQGASREEGARL